MNVVGTFDAVRKLTHGRVGLVPTMGYLHEGHIAIIETAALHTDSIVVSVFVNPLQFGSSLDLDTYPSDLERDVDIVTRAGADVVFAPSVSEMYPDGQSTLVRVAGVGETMEGENRPGHFDGVATVVAKLFSGLQPDVAFFGRKDAQQLAVVTTMARDLSMPVEVIGLPTVREADGLALSSRNTRLDERSRTLASRISRALFAAGALFADGERMSAALKGSVRSVLDIEPEISVDYIEVADADTARPIDNVEYDAFLAVAARIGGVRLIDNVFLDGRTGMVDTGTKLERPSILYGGR
ncbi:MAG: pantoate--beta-alanine ligase [Acidimicrobiia bacterium]|nr:MAG: pantoate--beta-alanine ligase [Acidimicrobiia bacterium]